MVNRYLISVLASVSCLAAAAPAAAQSTRTWVSGLGNDANPCTRTLPCQTFAGAISRTAAGGEINCMDAGGFGVLTITKAVSIICADGEAGVLATGTDGITINAATSDQIVLKGLDIQGSGTGLNGVNIQTAANVIIEDCNIVRFGGDGVLIATLSPVRVVIRGSTIGTNGSGVVVNSTPGFGHVRIFDTMIHSNANDGVQVDGVGNEAILSSDEILANTRQLNVSTGVSGGAIYSTGNSVIPQSSGDSPSSFPLM